MTITGIILQNYTKPTSLDWFDCICQKDNGIFMEYFPDLLYHNDALGKSITIKQIVSFLFNIKVKCHNPLLSAIFA